MSHRQFVAAYVVALVLTSTLSGQENVLRDRVDLDEIIRRHGSQPISEYSQFRQPSYPLEVAGIVSEWEPTEAVVLAIPGSQFLKDEGLAQFFMDIGAAAIECADVIWLVSEEDLHAQKLLLEKLREENLMHCIAAPSGKRMTMIPVPLNTLWVRDFGPVFIRNNQGRVRYADAIYRDVRQEEDASLGFAGFTWRLSTESHSRAADDVSPIYLANHLRHTYAQKLESERVPLQLWGGDLVDSNGNLFVSTDTLVMNGGRDEEVRFLLKRYYGMKNLTYLSPLPGPTIKHLDMVFKVVDDKTFLLCEYRPPTEETEDPFMEYLHREATRILEQNAKIIREEFPDRQIVLMPMPPLSRKQILENQANQMVARLFQEMEFDVPDFVLDEESDWTFERYIYLRYAIRALARTSQTGDLERRTRWMARRILDGDKGVLGWLADSTRDLVDDKVEASSTPLTDTTDGSTLASSSNREEVLQATRRTKRGLGKRIYTNTYTGLTSTHFL